MPQVLTGTEDSDWSIDDEAESWVVFTKIIFLQFCLSDADTPKSSSMLIYLHQEQSNYMR